LAFRRAAMDQQNHPLHGTDRAHVDRLLAVETPGDADLVDAARLLTRYEDFPGAPDLRDDLAKVLRLWGLDLTQLQGRTRALWSAGFRPAGLARVSEGVGSGFDTASEEAG
jgi:hypothetical protein